MVRTKNVNEVTDSGVWETLISNTEITSENTNNVGVGNKRKSNTISTDTDGVVYNLGPRNLKIVAAYIKEFIKNSVFKSNNLDQE